MLSLVDLGILSKRIIDNIIEPIVHINEFKMVLPKKSMSDLRSTLASLDWDALIYQYKHYDPQLFFRNLLSKKGLQARNNHLSHL